MVGDSGEDPDDVSDEEFEELDLGETVYDDDGNELGTIRGFDDAGFYVTMREGYEALSVEHARTGHEFGEGYLMWRCSECGEMGELDDELPEECPNCGAPKEDLYYWTED
ncbi:DUF7130 family rubredoxin-like protein [Candidatus Halobonum tyrrellensis]|uniref:DUF7130 domain-containing protein n=1 Tax=Candidatus Halobonum tyrrellensis G22 TaxID=1324957 RepID=V4GWN4_9EURY|nr:hypothetical protein K933_03455 [Candidatus Halobonum tyrrellensis G22]